MKLRNITAILLACAIATPVIAGQAPKGGHPKATTHTTNQSKSKLKSLGHGVYIDSAGKYRSKDGKFMSKADADKRLGKGTKTLQQRDSKGRFVKSSKTTSTKTTTATKTSTKTTAKPGKKPGVLSRLKSKLTGKH